MVKLLNSWRESDAVPKGWVAANPPGAVTKAPVHNPEVLKALRAAVPGQWVKVYHEGADGSELHYFQHGSGKVANVKHKRKRA